MTPESRRDAFIHIEDALKQCKEVCGHDGRRQNVLMALNLVIKLSNDEIKDMDEYRRKFNDPTS
jgi:hypothetical protein